MGRHIIIEGDELYHYGVKGMKWKDHVYATVENAGNAVRTSAAKVAGATSAFAKKFGQNAKKITRSAKAKVRTKVQDAKRKQYARDKSRVAKADEYDKLYSQLGTKSAKKTFKKSAISRVRDNAARKRLAKQQQVATSNRVSEAKRNRQSELKNQAALNKGTSKAQHKQNERTHNYNNRVAGQAQVKTYSSVDSRSSGRSAVDKRASKLNAARNAATSASLNKGMSANMSGRSGPSMSTLSSKQNSAKKSIITSNTSSRKKKAKTY